MLSKRRKLEGRTQGAISTETGEGENRYPSERSKITLWADEYMALGERTPSEFAAFQRGKENFENSEDSLPSYTLQAVPSSPCTPSKSQSTSQSTSSGVITIRYENHIIFSSSPNSKGTPQEIIRQAALTAKNKTVGSLVSITEEHTAGAPSKRPPSPLQKFKIIDLNLEYTMDDIPEIPTTTYNTQNYHQIPQDWEASAHLVIRGVPIPLKY